MHTKTDRAGMHGIAERVAVSTIACWEVPVGTRVVVLASLVATLNVEGVSGDTSASSGLLREKDRMGVALEPGDAMRAHPSSTSCGIFAP